MGRDSRPFIRLTGRQRSSDGGTGSEIRGSGRAGRRGRPRLPCGPGERPGPAAIRASRLVEDAQAPWAGLGLPVEGAPLRHAVPRPDVLRAAYEHRQLAGRTALLYLGRRRRRRVAGPGCCPFATGNTFLATGAADHAVKPSLTKAPDGAWLLMANLASRTACVRGAQIRTLTFCMPCINAA